LIGVYAFGYLQKEYSKPRLATGGITWWEPVEVEVEVGSYSPDMDTIEEARQVMIQWLEKNVYPQLEEARTQLMTTSYEEVNGRNLTYLLPVNYSGEYISIYESYNTFIDPLFIRYASEKPLTEKEVKPLTDFIKNQSKMMYVTTPVKRRDGKNQKFFVDLYGTGGGHSGLNLGMPKTGEINLPRGARILQVGCEIGPIHLELMKMKTENCISRRFNLHDGRIFKVVTVGQKQMP
ncbi:MAG: hypothetical protein ABH950_02315, partial [Candidatus Altiarchaeota archaeon]